MRGSRCWTSGASTHATIGILPIPTDDLDLINAYFRAYNTWQHEFSQDGCGRIVPIAVVNWRDVENAALELTRCLKLGFKGIFVPPEVVDGERPGSPHFDRLWAQLAEADLPGCLHVIVRFSGAAVPFSGWHGAQPRLGPTFGFGLGAFGFHLSPFLIVLCGLSFNNAGYLAEIFRGGFTVIPSTQVKAARSLGLTLGQTYIRIVIPQVLRIVYHPMTNQMVWSVLMSSLAMLVGYRELAGETQFLASKTYRIFEFFLVTAAIYYVIVKLILGASRLVSWRLFRY